jgi:hypothetical protein
MFLWVRLANFADHVLAFARIQKYFDVKLWSTSIVLGLLRKFSSVQILCRVGKCSEWLLLVV